jgi:tRNA-dihydrouridine synthase
MYKGKVDMLAFDEVYESLRIPLIYNGDISSRAEMQGLQERYPNLLGMMTGRGLLARPTMAKEFAMNKDLSDMELRNTILAMHADMLEMCTKKYKVDSQILLHIHAFWEYMEPQMERKTWKRIMKAGNLKNYLEAVKNI